MQLYQHQKELLSKSPKRYGLWWKMGMGKTIMALELAHIHGQVALIVCPKPLKEQWIRNCEIYPENHTVITKEEFRKIHKEIKYYNCIIIDECHMLSGHTSQLSKALLWCLTNWRPEYFYPLSATPVTSTPYSVMMLMKFFGIPVNYYAFSRKFFIPIPMGRKTIWKPNPKMNGELLKIVRTLGEVKTMNEVTDMPPSVFRNEYIDLNAEQKRAFKDLNEFQSIVRFTRCHQIEQGFIYGDSYVDTVIFPSEKMNRIAELCKQSDKVAIFCRYNEQTSLLTAYLADKCDQEIFVINGSVKNRDEVIQAAEGQSRAIILIQASCSAGYELPSFQVVIFASMSFSYVDYEQSCGRFVRINKPQSVLYIHLLTSGKSIDKAIYDCIKQKKDFYIELFKP